MSQLFARFGVDVTLLEAADRILAPEEPESSAWWRTRPPARASRCTPGRASARSRTPTACSASRPATRPCRPTSCWSRRIDGRTSPTSAWTPSGSTRTPGARHRRAHAGRRAALGDRRHHRQGRVHAHVDVPGRDRGPRHPRPGRSRCGVPRGAHGTFTDPEVGLGRDDREAGTRGRAHVRVGTTDLALSTRGWIAKGEGLVKLVEDADRGVLVGATAVGPSGGEVLSMLVTPCTPRSPPTRSGR